MKNKIRVSVVQMNSGDNVYSNLKKCIRFIKKASDRKSELIVFPESFIYRGNKKEYSNVSVFFKSKVIPELSSLAADNNISIICGSSLVKSGIKNKFFNTSYYIDSSGRIKDKYRKIHLFDVKIKGQVSIKESKYIAPGRKIVVSDINKIKIGFSICYDLRFPELYRKLTFKGAKIIVVPSNFTLHTGKYHWKQLICARAIENQVFMVCPNQWGKNQYTGIESYGHSMIVDPWGNSISEAGTTKDRLLTADLNMSYLDQTRKQVPCLDHVRIMSKR